MNTSALASLTKEAGPHIVSAIKKASARTGVNFSYLMEKAAAESGFDAKAKAVTSSATGLFQFLDKTWMTMVRKYGDKYGLGSYANKIDENGNVADAATRRKILALRNDPDKSACMAAELTAENCRYLQQHVGGDIGSTDLYLAHFLGANGATGFLNAMHEDPNASAAGLYPKAAAANHNVFYDSDTGRPRTLAGVYDYFARKFQEDGQGAQAAAATVQPANDTAPAQPTAAVSPVDANAVTIAWNNDVRNDRMAMIRLLQSNDRPVNHDTSRNNAGGIPGLGARSAIIFTPDQVAMLARLDPPGGARRTYNE